ncbi:MAG TPA: hypothetical protein VN426_11775 [Syntrophomonadaceae bacterium]|nr:hypothetical protein [Syntrophomonadaceae bacterium]
MRVAQERQPPEGTPGLCDQVMVLAGSMEPGPGAGEGQCRRALCESV